MTLVKLAIAALAASGVACAAVAEPTLIVPHPAGTHAAGGARRAAPPLIRVRPKSTMRVQPLSAAQIAEIISKSTGRRAATQPTSEQLSVQRPVGRLAYLVDLSGPATINFQQPDDGIWFYALGGMFSITVNPSRSNTIIDIQLSPPKGDATALKVNVQYLSNSNFSSEDDGVSDGHLLILVPPTAEAETVRLTLVNGAADISGITVTAE